MTTDPNNPWNFPVDPEPLSAEDIKAIRDGEDDARHGRCISTAELCRKHGIDLHYD